MIFFEKAQGFSVSYFTSLRCYSTSNRQTFLFWGGEDGKGRVGRNLLEEEALAIFSEMCSFYNE